jgi:hypothetical protein
MKQSTTQRSRRALLRKSSLGIAGTLGAASAASFISWQGNSGVAKAHTADVSPLVGVWDFEATLSLGLGLGLPLLPSVIHGQLIFWSSGIIGGVSDADALPILGGPMALGTWSMPVPGQFSFSMKRYSFPSLGKGVLDVQGTGTIDAPDKFHAIGSLRSHGLVVPVSFDITAQRQGIAVS